MSSNITVETEQKTINISGKNYTVYELFLLEEGEVFDVDQISETSDTVLNQVMTKYWNLILKLIPDAPIIVKLSGIDGEFQQLKKYTINADRKLNSIMHYHNWEIDDATEEISFFIIECNRDNLYHLYKKYWFSLASELSFNIIIMNDVFKSKLLRWAFRSESMRKDRDLLSMSKLIIDNQCNGFHFKITTESNIDMNLASL